MGMSAMDVAQELIEGAERARLDGDPVASIMMACKAREYLQLARLLGDSIAETEAQQREG